MINIKKISVVALILLLVGVAGALSTFNTINKAEQLLENKVITDNAYTTIDVMTDNARVEISPTNEATTQIELTGRNSKYQFSSEVEGAILSVELKSRTKFFNFGFTPRSLTLKIMVPKKMYDSIKVESNNGLINVEKVMANKLNLKTDNGKIELKDFEGSFVNNEADNGRIDLINVKAETVKVKASNGKIYFDNVDGNLIGKSNNGSIILITSSLDRSIEFETNNGKIDIQSENKPKNARIEASVDNGTVNIFGQSNRNAVFGNGKYLIKLSADNGKISLSK